MSEQQVQKICCVNNAAFVMSFEVQYLDPSTKEWTPISGTNTDNYPVGQSRTVDLSQYSFPQSALLRPYVFAKGGLNQGSDDYVTYAANTNVATYSVTGTTLIYSVTLIGSAVLSR